MKRLAFAAILFSSLAYGSILSKQDNSYTIVQQPDTEVCTKQNNEKGFTNTVEILLAKFKTDSKKPSIRAVKNELVKVVTYEKGLEWELSGIRIATDYIITSKHGFIDYNNPKRKTESAYVIKDGYKIPVDRVLLHPTSDLALIHTMMTESSPIEGIYFQTKELQNWQNVSAIYPNTAITGEITWANAIANNFRLHQIFQTNIAARKGNSGSPITMNDGQIVGILSAGEFYDKKVGQYQTTYVTKIGGIEYLLNQEKQNTNCQ